MSQNVKREVVGLLIALLAARRVDCGGGDRRLPRAASHESRRRRHSDQRPSATGKSGTTAGAKSWLNCSRAISSIAFSAIFELCVTLSSARSAPGAATEPLRSRSRGSNGHSLQPVKCRDASARGRVLPLKLTATGRHCGCPPSTAHQGGTWPECEEILLGSAAIWRAGAVGLAAYRIRSQARGHDSQR